MQQQRDGTTDDLTAELQRATASITTAEQESSAATAQLASAEAAYITALHELQVRLSDQVLDSLLSGGRLICTQSSRFT